MPPTYTPTSTKTPKPYKTSTPKPTKTPTKTPKPPTKTPTDTRMPSDDNAVFFNIARPPDPITDCLNYYKTDVIEPDGISYVKLFYVVDIDAKGNNIEPAGGDHVILDYTSGNSYSINSFKISTGGGGIEFDRVYYRFLVKDALGYEQYHPALTESAYSYLDKKNCGVVNYPTVFSSYVGPTGTIITDTLFCENSYMVNVDDANGIELVELAYSLDGGAYEYLIMPPHTVDGFGNGTYEIVTSIDTSTKAPNQVAVSYKFKAKDKLGNWTFDTTVFSFTDTINCTAP
jgi:hypothetical protein